MSGTFDEKWLRDYCQRTGKPYPHEKGNGAAEAPPPSAACGRNLPPEGGLGDGMDAMFYSVSAAKRLSKYGNKRTERGGRVFASKHEADVYDDLMLQLRAEEIYGVFCQFPFLLPGDVVYIADFVTLNQDGTYTVLDAKSEATRKDKVYRLKRRLMDKCLGIKIKEV